MDENKGRVKDTKKEDEKFKCEECSYETKKKIMRHVRAVRTVTS